MVENEHPVHRHREERSDAAISLQAQALLLWPNGWINSEIAALRSQ
jgi:hypothetical protein